MIPFRPHMKRVRLICKRIRFVKLPCGSDGQDVLKPVEEVSEKERDYSVVLCQTQEHNVMRNVILQMEIHLYNFLVHRRVSMEPLTTTPTNVIVLLVLKDIAVKKVNTIMTRPNVFCQISMISTKSSRELEVL